MKIFKFLIFVASVTISACTVVEENPGHTYGTFCGTDGGSTGGASGSGGTATDGSGIDGSVTGGTSSGGSGAGGTSTGGASDAGSGGTCTFLFPSFVQVGSQDQWGTFQTVSASLSSAQTAGDLNVVAINWYAHQDVTISTVTDTLGNAYTKAIGPVRSTSFTEYIYYAPNVAAGANSVTVTLSGSAEYIDVRVSEYAGFSASATAAIATSAIGDSVTSTVPGIVTTQPRELIYFAGATENQFVGMVSPAFSRLITPNDKDNTGDRIAVDPGTYSISGQNNMTSEWVAEAVAFTGNTQSCTTTTSYSTDFNTNESVISESGAWHSGDDPLQTPVSTDQGLAFGTQTGNEFAQGNFNDSTAYLSQSFPSNQRGSGVIHKANSGISNAYQEVEILLHWSVGALRTGLPFGNTHSFGYEINLAWNAGYVQIGRFKESALFDSLVTGSPITTLGVQDGDVFAAEIAGNVITATLTRGTDTTVIAQGTDNTGTPFASGTPGIAFYRNNNGSGTTTPKAFSYTHYDAKSF